MRKHPLGLGAIVAVLVWTASAALAEEGAPGLTLSGKVENGEVVLPMATIAALPQVTLTEQHVTMKAPAAFRGPSLTEVLALAKASGSSITMHALDDYVATATIADIERYHPILAIEMDGKPFTIRDFGPYFLVWPFAEHDEINTDAFHARSVWQLVKIEVR